MAHSRYEHCIEACQVCVLACEHCATACLREHDIHDVKRCIELDRSCADICALSVREMTRGSPFVEEVLELCAEVCNACANECSGHSMSHCQVCAQACRYCAQTCIGLAEGTIAITRMGEAT